MNENEPKLKVIFSKQGEERARALKEEELKALDHFAENYVKFWSELYTKNELERTISRREAPKND